MKILIVSTSAWLDLKTVLIETTVTIGDEATTSKQFYDTEELMESRFLSGDLDARIENLRESAQAVTEKAVTGHFAALAKREQAEPVVTEVPSAVNLVAPAKPKAKRAPRKAAPKKTSEE